jgi:hypothetical protein
MNRKPIVKIERPAKYRNCSICEDGTTADHEINFVTGSNSQASIAYCNNHFIQLSNEIHGITLEAIFNQDN